MNLKRFFIAEDALRSGAVGAWKKLNESMLVLPGKL